jgi:GNAT superfamily N-acetyltransferase
VGEVTGPEAAGLSPPATLLPAHQLAAFGCGEASLDDWLRHQALKSEGVTARTYVVCAGDIVVGYYCLATGSVARASVPKALRRHGTPNPIPVMVLGRLAVDTRHQGKGIGAGMLRDAMYRVLQLSRSVGCAALLVHALDQPAANFYAKYGFVEFPGGARTLFLPIATIAAAL